MADPTVAVVIPVHRQPSLLLDAVESVLRQRAEFDFRIVLVNDGCPFQETDEVCRSYARRLPDRIRYLRLAHGGISAARNAGVSFALKSWPTVEAVQFLNADDRLGPRALQEGLDALRAAPEAAWSFPGSHRTGSISQPSHTNGGGSRLDSVTRNSVPHASMVARRVWDLGLRFDESMNSGFQDWDFSMQCVREGMRGVRADAMVVQRRALTDSGIPAPNTNDFAAIPTIQRKHESWCTPRLALEIEHEESPRFAIVLIDEGRVLLTSDPGKRERSFPVAELGKRLAHAATHPNSNPFPLYIVVTSDAFLRVAGHGRFASGLLWLLQYELIRSDVAMMGASLTEVPGTEYAFDVLPPGPRAEESAPLAIALMRTPALLAFLRSGGTHFRERLLKHDDRLIRARPLRYTHPNATREFRTDVLAGLADLIDQTGSDPACQRMLGRTTLHSSDGGCDSSIEASRRIFASGPVYPRILDRTKVHVGFVLPICRFGGADRATMNLGRETRRRGWTPHLFVIGSGTAQLLSEFRDTFETITVVEPWELWQPYGLLGLLGTMDVVVNNLSTPTNDVFKLLRRHGIKTICHLHSVIISTNEMPSGQAYEMLRHEKDVDGVIVISRKLLNWCKAWGVPREKLIFAPNAPSFEVSDALVRTTMQKRLERPAGSPLNILYLGRFDWEKGMDRLLAIYERTRREAMPVEWRIVGGRVCGSVTTTDRELESIQSVMTPPVMTRSGLARLYAWADVVIMVSRFEGVPLTLLEAQRMGGVVLSTNVGAIGEIVESGKTGYLFSNDLDTPALVDQMVDCLRGLQADRATLTDVAQASAGLRSRTTWSVNAKPFTDFVDTLLTPAVNINA